MAWLIENCLHFTANSSETDQVKNVFVNHTGELCPVRLCLLFAQSCRILLLALWLTGSWSGLGRSATLGCSAFFISDFNLYCFTLFTADLVLSSEFLCVLCKQEKVKGFSMRHEQEDYQPPQKQSHPFLKFWAAVTIIIAITASIVIDIDWIVKAIFLFFAFLLAYWIRYGGKCPKCGEPHAMCVVDREVLRNSGTFRKKDSDGKYHYYDKITELVTRRCEYCDYETVNEEQRDERLD